MVAKLPPLFVEVYGDSPTFGDRLAFKMVQMAAKGNMSAMNSILDRVEGKPVQGIRHSADEEKSVAFKVEIVHVGRVFEDV